MDIKYNLRTVANTLAFNKQLLSDIAAYVKLIYVKSGTYTLICNEKSYVLESGESVIIPPFTDLKASSLPDSSSSVSLFSYLFPDNSFAFHETRELEIYKPLSDLSNALKEYFAPSVIAVLSTPEDAYSPFT